jgi:hypothetical protein
VTERAPEQEKEMGFPTSGNGTITTSRVTVEKKLLDDFLESH